MNKSDLVDSLVERVQVPRKRVELVVNLMLSAMTAALARGERIEIRRFGSFRSKRYRARTGHNPRTSEEIVVAAKSLPCFKVGKELRERVDAGSAPG